MQNNYRTISIRLQKPYSHLIGQVLEVTHISLMPKKNAQTSADHRVFIPCLQQNEVFYHDRFDNSFNTIDE